MCIHPDISERTAAFPPKASTLCSLGWKRSLRLPTSATRHALCTTGRSDEAIAEQLPQQGYRSPKSPQVLPSTVKTLRLKHGLLQKPSQSHPRRKAGYLTIPQLAQLLGVSRQWLHDRIQNGRIQVCKDLSKGVYLFPDHPTTVERLQQLQAGTRGQVSFLAPEHPADGAQPPVLENRERA